MTVTITWQSAVTVAAVTAALAAIWAAVKKGVMRAQLPEEQAEEIKGMKAELRILAKGVLACLRGLQEQGCDGPVTSGIAELEDFLNKQAHA